MAVSGTVPARSPESFDPLSLARRLRRWTVGLAVLGFTWFLLKFGTAWVPANMDTVPSVPPGSWVIVDRWSSGLRVGSDVFVATPAGRLLTRVAALDDETVTVLHPNGASAWPDSKHFGLLRRDQVESTVMVVFLPGKGAERGK